MNKLLIFILLLTLGFQTYAQLEALDGTQALTEQEEDESKNYVHQGRMDEAVFEACAAENATRNEGKASDKQRADFCNNQNAYQDGTFGGTLEKLMPAVTKAYAMFGPLQSQLGAGASQGIEFYKKEDANGNRPVAADGKKEKQEEGKTDVCQYIPMATEMGAQALQISSDQQTTQNYEGEPVESQQSAAFYALSSMHRTKKKSAIIQASGWGATSACYVTYLASGAVMDFKMGLKIGASALIGTFYGLKAKKHGERADALELMAQNLPGAGECNPHTKTTCFCNHESSFSVDPTNYQKYCVPSGYSYNPAGMTTGCVDSKGKVDSDCSCKKKGTCITTTLGNTGFSIGLNPTALKNALGGLKHFDNGFGSDNLLAAANKNFAMAKRALKKYKPKGKLPRLNKIQKDLARSLVVNGIPQGLAVQMAGSPIQPSSQLLSTLKSGFSNKDFNSKRKKYVKKNGFKKGKTIKGKRKSGFAAKIRKRSGKGTSGTQIMDFASQATMDAEITKDSSKGIFDIITNRYKVRAWQEFKDDVIETKESAQ